MSWSQEVLGDLGNISESWSLSWILSLALLTGASALALPSFTLIQQVDIMVTPQVHRPVPAVAT